MIERIVGDLKGLIARLGKKERPLEKGMVRTTVDGQTIDVQVPDYVPPEQRQAWADTAAAAFSGNPSFTDLTRK